MRLALNNTLNSITSKEFSNNYSMSFDGTDEYLTLGDTLNLGTDNFSIAFWTKLDDADNQGFISKRQGANDFWRVRTITSTKELYVVGKSGGVTAFTVTGGADVTPLVGSWIHVCVSVDRGGDINLYVNGDGSDTTTYGGSADISSSSSVDIDNTGQLEIGRFSSDYLDGKMDEVAIWDVALDGDTVDSIYNSGTPNDLTLSASYTAGSGVDKSGNLLSYWRMGDGIYDSGSGEVIFDQETPTIGENLITDPIFATGTGWTASGGTGLISERSTEKPQSGDYSWKFETNGVATSKGVTTSAITVDANTVYRFSYWAYAPSANSSSWMNIECATGNDWNRLGSTQSWDGANIPADTWTEVVGFFRTESSPLTIQVRIGNGGSAGADGDVRYFDNVSMVKVGGNPAIMENMDSNNIVTDTP